MAIVNSSRINAKESFQWAVQKQLEAWGSEVIQVTQEVIPEVSKEAVKRLQKASPRRKKNGGKYAKGWTYKIEKGRMNVGATIYGKSGTYQLAHLLEHGHARRGGGRDVDGIEHIKPVEQWLNDEIIDRTIERLSK